MQNSKIISIEGLVKKFPIGRGEFTALRGIDLSFGKGEFAGIVGPSGSGKTTLLNIIGSLDTPSEGKTVVYVAIANFIVVAGKRKREKHSPLL